MKNIMTYENFVEERHKHHADFPHWYLQNLAVSPEHQKKGMGRTLMEEGLSLVDKEGLPSYLETQNERNVTELLRGISIPRIQARSDVNGLSKNADRWSAL